MKNSDPVTPFHCLLVVLQYLYIYFIIPDSHRGGTGHNDPCAAGWAQHSHRGGQYSLELISVAAACTHFQWACQLASHNDEL